ncbi:MAG: efflux RND transporter periplasmic adaptor subunit [Nitrospirota bacterium]|nr:efflux RND transporter periplasmic adaptor subunit [Nitrospirota bacterium]
MDEQERPSYGQNEVINKVVDDKPPAWAVFLFGGLIFVAVGAGLLWLFRDHVVMLLGKPVPMQAATPMAQGKTGAKVLFYRHPMNPSVTSPVPAKDNMGMDYIPVYEGQQETEPGMVKISPEKIQKIGVKSEAAVQRSIRRSIRTTGYVDYDETRIYTVNTKYDGWIEKLYVNATGQEVSKGQPLLDIYAPDLVAAQEEYFIARELKEQTKDSPFKDITGGSSSLEEATARRLKFWDITEGQLKELGKRGEIAKTMTVYSPVHGIVVEKSALQGKKTMSGEPLFKVADISTVWLHADLYEADLAAVRMGTGAKITFNAFPGRVFYGKVVYLYPYLQNETRTARARIELANPDLKFRPSMYANVQFDVAEGSGVAVPEDALIDTGERQVVIIDRGEGRFEPRNVVTGPRGDGFVLIVAGVKAGEKVVTSANFLIDSESSFRAALK